MSNRSTAATRQGAPFAGQHAVVIGGSIAGLLAGRVLADHFADVTIIERDAFAETAEPRKGVPQGRHVHGLLNQGRNLMSDLFPDLLDDMLANGTIQFDMGADIRWYHMGQWKLRFQSGIDTYSHSRPLLELQIRKNLAVRSNVRFLTQTDATGLQMNPAGTQVTGVHIEHRDGSHTTETLPADLVVEAGGRGSRVPQWLESLGYGHVEESVVKMDVCYTTRIYRRPANAPDWEGLLVYPTPPEQKRMGVITHIEGDRWMVSMCGWHHDDPPTDDAGFLEYARNLPVPDIYLAIKDAEPLTSAVSHRIPSDLRRHYERLARFPEGLAVVGDAVCSFNPIYGQGMTTAALEAKALDVALRRQATRRPAGDITGFAPRFRKDVARAVAIPWLMATGEDFRFPETTGPRLPGIRLLHLYTNQLHAMTAYDSRVLLQFLQVMHMLKSPVALFSPPIVAKVLAHRLGRRPTAARPVAAPHLSDRADSLPGAAS